VASIVKPQPAAHERSAARAFWNGKMAEHPNIAGLLAIAGEVAGFFLNGRFIVALASWLIRVSGSVAESALLLAQEVRQAVPDTTEMREQIQQLRADIEEIAKQLAHQDETGNETIEETEEETNIIALFHQEETKSETETETPPRVTRKLKQERNETQSETNNARGAARQKALRVLKRNPKIDADELAKRAGITPQYARQILKRERGMCQN
jgi:hypothetical protein